MASFFNNFLHGMAPGDHVKDYHHASNLFLHDNFRLAPKPRFLYQCNIILNNSVALPSFDQLELSFMVKTATLPGVTFEISEHRQYNRKAYNYTGINYSPVTISFHDDNSNNVRNFLANVYSYYINDGNKSSGDYNIRNANGLLNTYDDTSTMPGGSWGLDSRFSQSYGLNLIKEIQIYSLSKGKGSKYTLKNPVITQFNHGEHNVSDTTMNECQIQVSYDAFQYGDGMPPNFGAGFYDRSPSVLSGGGRGTNSVIGPGGMFDTAMDAYGNLKSGNLIGAALDAYKLKRQIRSNDTRDLLKNELRNILPSVANQVARNASNSFPTATIRRFSQMQAEGDAGSSGDAGGGASGTPDMAAEE